jgi:hypothetical protein
MKLFPTKNFTAELKIDYSISMENLKLNTDITNTLTSARTKSEFRGQVNEKGFKIISSEIGRGAICVLNGKFTERKGEIEIRIHNAFKVMFSILLLYPFIGFGIITFQEGIKKAIEFLPMFLIVLLFIRFVFIELSFRFISNTGINKLAKALNIIELKKT